MLKGFLKKTVKNKNLGAKEMIEAMEIVMSGRASDIQISAFLTSLAMKGETAEEITAAAEVMKAKALKVNAKSDTILDTCGSGGDGKGTINVSSAVAVIAAAAGITVAKHGNRSITSKSGSADVFEALGVNIEASPAEVEKCLEECGIGFIFAPGYHTAMKHVMPARKGLGFRTIFNILGPLINPAMHTNHLMGVFDIELAEKITMVFKGLGMKHTLVVHGAGGIDEVSTQGDTLIMELKNGEIKEYNIKPGDFGIKESSVESLKGGGPEENAGIMKEVFGGKRKDAYYDVVLINSGAAIYTGDKAESIKEGVEKAREILGSGAASRKLNEFLKCSG